MIELVDYETYVTLTPEERILQKLQAAAGIMMVAGMTPLPEGASIETMKVEEVEETG